MKKYILLLLACLTLQAQKKYNIALLDLSGSGVMESDLIGMTNRLRSELFTTGAFTMLERTRMNEILKEQKFQLTGCTLTECAIQAGRLLNINFVVFGSIDKVSSIYSINIRLVNVESGKIEKIATEDCNKCVLDDVFLIGIRNVALKLAGIEPALKTESNIPAVAVSEKKPVERSTLTKDIKRNIDSIKISGQDFVFINSGSVVLKYSSKSHNYSISRSFYISKNKITQGEWIKIMKDNPSSTVNVDSPVDNVSWEETQEFIEKLNRQDATYYYRLPTELEWEYVAHNSFGINGLFDSINEWCDDWYNPYTFENEKYLDTQGPKRGTYKVIKVCAGHSDSEEENRKFDYPKSRNYGEVGFRLVATKKF